MEAQAVTGDGEENSAAGKMRSRGLRLAAGAGTFLLIAGLLYFAWVDLRCAGTFSPTLSAITAKASSGSRRY